MDLTELRGQLDVVDAELVRLFEQRMQICEEVAEYKKETGRKVYDQAREQEKVRKVRA
ncbi:MAG: chorismate mutase, partial [Lachnospiraceae bacterium]|nr:chorismate mutase [Lachnospiraceae bacterium]